MVGPGATEILLYLATVADVDGASVFIVSDTGAVTVSHPGGFALVIPVIFSVVALDSQEPMQDLLFPNVGFTSDVSSDMAFYCNERIVASTNGSKMVRVTACRMKVAIPSGQTDRVLVLATGSSVPVDPTADSAYGSEVSVIVDEGEFLDVAQTELQEEHVQTSHSRPVSCRGNNQAPLVSDHKRAVQTIKRLRGQPETGLRFRPRPTQRCVLVYPDSALHNADAKPAEEGSDDEWWAKAKAEGYSCPFPA